MKTMRTKDFALTANDFHLLWRSLCDREEKLKTVIDTHEDTDSDEVVCAHNDIVYLRTFKKWFEEQGRPVFGDSVFNLSDEPIQISDKRKPNQTGK